MAKPKKDSVMLELVSDKQLTDIKKTDDLLFAGKIAIKEEGGFKKLYDLPGLTLLDRCMKKYDSMQEILDVRVKQYGWIVNRDSGWCKYKCVLFANLGLIFIYVTPITGYVLKLSLGKKLEVRSGRKKIIPVDKQPENCLVKIKFGFGALELNLTSVQTASWRQPLLNAFDGNLPCFELSKKALAKTTNAPQMVDVSVSTCSWPKKSTASLSDTASSFSHKLAICSEVSELSTCSIPTNKSSDRFMTNQRFLTPLKEIDEETTAIPEMVDSLLLTAETAEAMVNDSGFGSNEEFDKSIEGSHQISSIRSFMFNSTTNETPSMSERTFTTVSTQLTPVNKKMNTRMLDTSFNLPVYRLETEREKLSRRETPGRIADKIRYFEEMLNGTGTTEARFAAMH